MSPTSPSILADAETHLRALAKDLREQAERAERMADACARRTQRPATTIVYADELVPGDVWVTLLGQQLKVATTGRVRQDEIEVGWDDGLGDGLIVSRYPATWTFSVIEARPPADPEHAHADLAAVTR